MGYFDDFRGEPTILMIGPGSAHKYLGADLARFGTGHSDVLAVTGLPYVEAHGNLEVAMYRVTTSRARGLIIRPGLNAPVFDWLLNHEVCAEISEKLISLSEAVGSGHQYLEVLTPEDALVMASRGE